VDFRNDKNFDERLIELAREIHGAPAISKPPLGPNPFSGTPIVASPTRAVGPTGAIAPGQKILENEWFSKEYKKAQQGITNLKLAGSFVLEFCIQSQSPKSNC
jgi:hypothetical protein